MDNSKTLGMKLPSYSEHIKHWALDQEIVFLNHGSFGATPKAITEKQIALLRRFEAEPIRFMVREMYDLYYSSLGKLAKFVGAKESNLVFLKNTTAGVNTILHSLKFDAGDEILIHSHAYGACVNTIKFYAEKNNVKVNCADIPFPIKSPDEVVEGFVKALTPKTKLVLLDHITSPTGIIFPVEQLTKIMREKNIEVLIDGAHAPGQLHLELDKLGADYYVGNCHKWICSPKGSALLHVREDKQKKILPMQISHNFDVPVAEEKKWQSQFFWPGTDDYTSYCLVGESIEYFENNFDGGWNAIRKYNRELTLKARKHIAGKVGTALPAPDEMIANLATIYLGEAEVPPYGFNYISPLQEKLFSEYKIEVPCIFYNRAQPRQWVRITTQLYNSMEQSEYLADALSNLL
jgi:isopenicillin-N epimerase